MDDLRYDFLNDAFTTYENVESPKVTIDMFGDQEDVSNLFDRVTPKGNPIVKQNLPESSQLNINNTQEVEPITPVATSETSNSSSSNTPPVKYSKASKDVMGRAVTVARYLVNNGNFTKEQAAAIAGVMIDENKVDPSSHMAAEKKGRGARGTGGFGYGAGIGSWTFEKNKNDLLRLGGYKPYTPIENLSLEEQLKLLVLDSNNRNKRYYDALRRCTNLEDASATAVIITGGVGHSKNWSTHPTRAEAQAMSDYYGRSNDARFGKSAHHWNAYKRRLDYARQVLENL